jgi:hypothetical protein
MVNWIALMLHILEDLGSNLGPENNYIDRYFIDFLKPCRPMLG